MLSRRGFFEALMANVYTWSKTAAANAGADPDITWTEGQLPGSVNDSARQMMASVANWRDDQNGTLTTGGSANAQTVTTNAAYSALAQGLRLVLRAGFTNTGAATLNVTPNGGAAFGAKAVKILSMIGEVDPGAGQIRANAHYAFEYDTFANGGSGAWILLNPSVRALAANAPILYVDAAGSDSNSGLSSSSAFATLQKAADTAKQFDGCVGGVQIKVADGSYSAGALFTGSVVGNTTIQIVGNNGTPGNVVIDASAPIKVQDHCGLTISGVRLKSTAGGTCLEARQFSIIDFSSVEFDQAGQHISATDNSAMSCVGSYAITGNAAVHVGANNNSLVHLSTLTCTIGSARAFTIFASASGNSIIDGTPVYSGGGVAGTTGKRYQAIDSLITTTVIFPGNTAGSFDRTATNTNDNALAGYLGELVEANVANPGSGISSGTPFNLTSLSLTGGDWEVMGHIHYVPANGAAVSWWMASVSLVSATLDFTNSRFTRYGIPYTSQGVDSSALVGPTRISVNATTTVYLVGDMAFTSTCTAYGVLRARRVR
jgi:hypothetical protein